MLEKFRDRIGSELFLEPQIHFDGAREMIIENCRRIEECSDVFMSLVSGRHCIRIWGSNLRADDYKTGGLVVTGNFTGVEFIERGGRKSEG